MLSLLKSCLQASIIPCWWWLYLWPRSQPRLWPNTDIAIGHKDCAMVKIDIKSSSTDAYTERAKKSVILNQNLLLLWLWLEEGRPGRFWVGLMELLLWWWGVFLWRPWSTSPVKITAALICSWLKFQTVVVIWGLLLFSRFAHAQWPFANSSGSWAYLFDSSNFL